MAAPIVSAYAWRAFDQLPEWIRQEDEEGDYPLLKFISLVADQAQDARAMLDRFTYEETDEASARTSELTDPDLADEDWLPWLAQLVGVRFSIVSSAQEKRDNIKDAASGWKAGTRTAIANAAKTALTGTKYVQVYPHRDGAGTGDEWDVLIVTRQSETPDVNAVLETIVRKRAKPAGVQLHHIAYSSSWDTITSNSTATWATMHTYDNWTEIEEVGLTV